MSGKIFQTYLRSLIQTLQDWGWGCRLVVRWLPGVCKALEPSPSSVKLNKTKIYRTLVEIVMSCSVLRDLKVTIGNSWGSSFKFLLFPRGHTKTFMLQSGCERYNYISMRERHALVLSTVYISDWTGRSEIRVWQSSIRWTMELRALVGCTHISMCLWIVCTCAYVCVLGVCPCCVHVCKRLQIQAAVDLETVSSLYCEVLELFYSRG